MDDWKIWFKVLGSLVIGLLLAFLLNAAGLPDFFSWAALWAAFAAAIGCAYVQYKLVRCPHCKSYVKRGWDGTFPVYCPRCGKKLGEGRLE